MLFRYTVFIVFLSHSCVYAQTKLDKAHVLFEDLKYYEAIDLYEEYLHKNSNLTAQANLFEAYVLTNQYVKAQEAVLHLINAYGKEKEYLLKYAEILIINRDPTASRKVLEDYIHKYDSTSAYERLYATVNMSTESMTENKCEVEKVGFSSGESDFSPMFYGDELIFTSHQGGKIDAWTGRSYANIYTTKQNMTTVELLKGNLNGKFHNGAISFLDNETLVFTRNNGQKGDNQDYNLILALAKKKGEQWHFDQELPFNDKNFSNAYPAYLPTTHKLFFSSNRPGGFGGMDLYYSKFDGNKWSDPTNLGSDINTEKDEVFAYTDGIHLYFSSNGYAGLGGLDIYKASIVADGIGEIMHLGSPINTHRDDFGLITADGMNTGYFCSNREGDGNVDNIYAFNMKTPPLRPEALVISGKVIDLQTKIPLKETEVKLINMDDNTIQTYLTGDDGRFSFDAWTLHNYELSGLKNNIKTSSESIKNTNVEDNYYFTLVHDDPRFSLEGYAVNNATEKGEEGVKVINFNKNKRSEDTVWTDTTGFFKFQLDSNSDFEISGNKGGYYTSVSEATTRGLNRSKTLYVKLFLAIEEVIIGDTKILGMETFGGYSFDQVYYDLDKSDIRPDAAMALDKVVYFLQKNPTLTIELGSHTDSRASEKYNMDLSHRRAEAAVAYIVGRGISSDRIVARGYGESFLTNRCSDGIPCTEDDHQLNRRTEIKVIGK